MPETTFTAVSELLEKIQEAKPMQRKEDIFKDFLSRTKANKCSMYPVIRLIIPNLDNSRPKSGLHVNTIGKIYVKTLHLGNSSPDAIKLTQRQSVKAFTKNVHHIMKTRSSKNSKLYSWIEINQILDKLCSSPRKAIEIEFMKIVSSMSPLEQKWLLNILLKKLDIGLSTEKLFGLYHPNASQLYNRNTDLVFVCNQVDSGKCSSELCGANLFNFVKPMLCQRIDSKKINEILSGNEQFIGEEKMDGERFQIHYDSRNSKLKYFSRKGNDYTHKFENNLSLEISRLFDSTVQNCILDGEMMVWDKSEKKFKVKGEFIDVKNLGTNGGERPCFVCYDILYFNQKSLIDSSYSERFETLRGNFKTSIGVFHLMSNTKIGSLSSFNDYFNKSLENKSEGIVLKKCSSFYKPGQRLAEWIKVKPDYIEGLITDLDVLVIGVNTRYNTIESFYIGVMDMNEVLHCVGKVSSGLSEAKRIVLSNHLKPYFLKQPPENVKFGDEKPYYYLNIEKSVVLQIRASELVASSSYATPSTVRFPRIDAIRSDKAWKDCMKLSEYEDLSKSSSVSKIHKRKTDESDFSGGVNKVKVFKSNPYKEELGPITEVLSKKFLNQNFCILSTSKPHTVIQAKEMILRLSGSIIENPSPKLKCICIAGDLTPKTRAVLKSEKYSVISFDWLVREFKTPNKKPMFLPRDLIFATEELKEHLKFHFDEFSDSYEKKVTYEELTEILKSMKTPEEDISNEDILKLEIKLYGKKSINIFRPYKGFFEDTKSFWLKFSKNIFKFYGGEIVSDISRNKDSQILYFCEKENLRKIKNEKILYINYKWILDCKDEKTILDFKKYIF
ncbi:LIG4 family protein [Megaselia abdita]